jgi:putative FmdB family regulatory protein
MPLYEYVCEQDGTVLELMSPMSQADAPVEDPDHKGRTFKRQHSTFATGGGPAGGRSIDAKGAGGSLPMAGGCCPCGKGRGQCSN